jgi:hypothetical protein
MDISINMIDKCLFTYIVINNFLFLQYAFLPSLPISACFFLKKNSNKIMINALFAELSWSGIFKKKKNSHTLFLSCFYLLIQEQ